MEAGTVPRLTESDQEFVAREMAEQGIDSVSQYFSGLLQAERRRRADRELSALIKSGYDSGDAGPMTDADWAALARLIDETEPQPGAA